MSHLDLFIKRENKYTKYLKMFLQFNTKPISENNQNSLKTNNDIKFINISCKNVFQEKRIMHKKTCTYTPQHNGVVERKHKYLQQVARVLMFESKLPKRFWGEAILTVTHIINDLPNSVLK